MNISKRKTFLKKIFILCGAFIFVALWINYDMLRFAKQYIKNADDECLAGADCILVLGARVWRNGQPSHILEDRIIAGIAPALLMSGDHSRKNYDEVKAMKQYAVERNIPADRVFTDHAGFSTYDSCYRARDVFCAKKVVIVTQQYHLYRALYIARCLGLEAYGVASDRRFIYGEKRRQIREFFARIKAVGAVLIKASPRYLGEQIPIQTSSGSATDG